MVSMNKILMVAIFAITLVVFAGAASATQYHPLDGLTVTADTVQTNGHYIGVPTIVNGETYTYGYNYTLVPDGTYTVFGTITNKLDYGMNVEVGFWSKTGPDGYFSTTVNVPAAGSKPATVHYSVTIPAGYAASAEDIDGAYAIYGEDEEIVDEAVEYSGPVDFSNTDYVDVPQSAHSVDEGPMSNMVVIFNNGMLSSNASVIYSLNLTSDDYKALYTNGKMDFHGSPLYAFAE